jgi:hypothetical protein
MATVRFRPDPEPHIVVDGEVCRDREGAITWRYPGGGLGVSFRDA